MEIMGTQQQGPGGRKRLPNRDRPTAEDDALNQIAREAEARLAAKRAARAEAREIRMKELERQQKEVEERPEKDFEKGVRTVPSLSAATLASLGGTSSRRGSGDTSISVDTEASIREIKDINELKDQIHDVEGKYMQGLKEMKDSLVEVEEKYKKAMVSNAQLDNEKTNFMYQVDTLKDALLELEEQLAESRRQYEEKNKDFEREKHAHAVLQFQFMEVKESLKQREELLAEIHQLQQKQEGSVREISDLQETIEWKEKKIGALERQKEFFDSIRSERDDLREEVIVLKEQLKQHGIILNSEVATNGEPSGALDKDELTSKIVPGTSHAPKEGGDATLGRANEVEMKNEILENVGKKEILQNTEHEEHTEETKEQEIVQECSEIKTLHDDENAEAEKITEGKVVSTFILNSGLEESAKSHSEHVSEPVYALENSGAVELRNEGGSVGDSTAVEESGSEKVECGNIVNKTGNQVADSGTETHQEINAGSETLPEQQNKENQKEILTDEAEDNELFEETLDFVKHSHMGTSSQLESPELADDTHAKAASIDINIESSCNAKENTEKDVESDLEREFVEGEGGIKITDKPKWDKNEADGTNNKNEAGNSVQQEETKVVASVVELVETSHTCEDMLDEFAVEQKEVEMVEPHSLSLKHEACVEEKHNKQEIEESENNPVKSPAKEIDQSTALLGELGADSDSEKKHEQDVVQGVSHSECHSHEERNLNLDDETRKCQEIKSEFIDENKTLVDIPTLHEEEYSQTQGKEWPTEEQDVSSQSETSAEPAITTTIKKETVDKVPKGSEEDKNCGKAEKEVLEVTPDTKETAYLKSQKAEPNDQGRKSDSEEEEVVEEYHEAFDFDESPFGELKATEQSSQSSEEDKNYQTQEKDGIAESAGQSVIKEDFEQECRDKEKVEDKKKTKNPNVADEVINASTSIESDENIQQEKEMESEEAEHLHTVSDTITVKHVTEYASEQFKRLGSSVDEIEDETQVGRKGKGKSREDCAIS